MSNYKKLKCFTCPEVLLVDRNTERCQCSRCILTNQPYPRHHHYDDGKQDDARQLFLGEAAS